jgi:uncharacterized membrane protein
MTEQPAMQARTARLQRLALGCYLALILLTLAWEGWLAPKGPPGFWLTIKSVPLLLPLFGLLHGRARSYLLASLLLLPYLTEGLVLLWTERRLGLASGSAWPWAGAEAVLSLVFVISAAWVVRLRRAQGESLAR